MQNTNAYVASEEREEIANEGKAAQQLEQILASGLLPLYRRVRPRSRRLPNRLLRFGHSAIHTGALG